MTLLRTVRVAVVAVTAFAATLGAFAEDSAPAPAAVTSPPSSSPSNSNEIVCKRVRETGSHISHKVCKTRTQMDAEALAARNALERSRSGTNTRRSGEGGGIGGD